MFGDRRFCEKFGNREKPLWNYFPTDLSPREVLASAGYAADGLRDFMNILRKKRGDEPTSYLSTHPAPVDRVKSLEKLVVDNSYDRYRYMGVKRHQEIKERLKNL